MTQIDPFAEWVEAYINSFLETDDDWPEAFYPAEGKLYD